MANGDTLGTVSSVGNSGRSGVGESGNVGYQKASIIGKALLTLLDKKHAVGKNPSELGKALIDIMNRKGAVDAHLKSEVADSLMKLVKLSRNGDNKPKTKANLGNSLVDLLINKQPRKLFYRPLTERFDKKSAR